MPSNYAGIPTYPELFQLADDGVPPNASEVNVGLEALADRTAWLRREMGRAFSRFSARNFVSCRFSAATEVLGGVEPVVPEADARAAGFAADSEYFYLALRFPGTSADLTYVVKTRDGLGWSSVATLASVGANLREYAALASRGDGWFIAGMSTILAGGAGQRIDVVNPIGAKNVAVRTSLLNATNYSAAEFAADRAYCFGGLATMNNGNEPGNSARVVSASLAGEFVDWGNPTGGAIGGALSSARRWRTAVLGSLIVATCPESSSSEIVRVDASTNTVTQPTIAGAGVVASNPVVWGGRFWIAKYDAASPGSAASFYSSADGANWAYESTLTGRGDLFITMLLAEQQTLLAFEASGGGIYTGSYASVDGAVWERTALSTRLDGLQMCASTAHRSAFFRQQWERYGVLPNNMRISLGGLL